ncbi:hypothetical protein RIF29_26283 [Crotalaria pallida]|uniref:Uncharacterized protein n=1 Tax=Crotalaria pallida TaxID=3830 RepID=A0AAN9ENG6_CROPI
MENSRGKNKMKVTMKILNENVSPLKIEMDDYQRGRYLQRYAENIDATAGSPLRCYFFAGSPISGKFSPAGELFTSPIFGASKYSSRMTKATSSSSGNRSFGSRGKFPVSPLSSLENLEISPPAMYRTPVKAEEEVLVMDDIQVRMAPGSKIGRTPSSASGRGQLSSSMISSRSPPFVMKSVLKTEPGNCRFNSKCQQKFKVMTPRGSRGRGSQRDGRWVAPGKEELHQIRPSMMPKSEVAQGRKEINLSSPFTNSKSKVAQGRKELNLTSPSTKSKSELSKSATSAGSSIHNPNRRLYKEAVEPFKLASDYWSPLDDGIKVVFPDSDKAPTREELEEYILRTHSCPSIRRRLPVFREIWEDPGSLEIDTPPPSPYMYSKKSLRGRGPK